MDEEKLKTYSSPLTKTDPHYFAEEPVKYFDSAKGCRISGGPDPGTKHQPINVPVHLLKTKQYTIEIAQKWLKLPGKDGKEHTFPLQTILPKVLMTTHVPPKTLPRDVEVDRRRSAYDKLNFFSILEEKGIISEDLLPTEAQYYTLTQHKFEHFLPLSFFDNTDFDTHAPEAWLNLGKVEKEQYPLPARAFVPLQGSSLDNQWQYVAVKDYDATTNLWLLMVLDDERQYEVPKVQIYFFAENPTFFAMRLKDAIKSRNDAESLVKMESIVDCVLLQDFSDERFTQNERVENLLASLKADFMFMRCIRREVYLLFEHLMAVYEFDNFVKLLPKEFPDFVGDLILRSLPHKIVAADGKQEIAQVKKLELNIRGLRYSVLKAILFYTSGGIEAMGNVAAECQYVETLLLFICTYSKPLSLHEFLNSQQEKSNNVAHYLKTFWPQKISGGIIIVLRPLGKGWLDISLRNWSVYEMCKITRFIVQVRFRMQESMQVLLERSIINFANFLIEPCKQFLELDNSYKWPKAEYIQTQFPYVKPIFHMTISVSEEEKVIYSTNPEEFESELTDLFKKVLEKTNGVRWINAEVLTNLRFAPNLFILSVELIEDLYVHYNEILHQCYSQAVIPLKAYAKLYERFISFYLLNVNKFMLQYAKAQKTSLQVKMDILEHKRQKEELRQILPAYIVIGPFSIYVDPMKQLMIRKHIEIVKRLFEFYIQRMYDINEALLERCENIYNKINERPQSIEHLFDIRDYAITVPDVVEDLRADIQIMWLEYEMLDSFFYSLTDQQFDMKWRVYAWPHKILTRLTPLREEQKLDIEEFRRQHMSEIVNFEERLESLNEEIQAFSLHFDPNKVNEISVEVKKTWKIIQDLQKVGNTLKFRQELFELEELSLDFLNSIINGFSPYRNLWGACFDYVKLEEATIGNPIVNIELDDVWTAIQEIRAVLKESFEVFNEKEEIQEVASYYLNKLDEFEPIYHCIIWLRNENWLLMHWHELNTRGGMEIKYSAAMNFSYCIRKGIMEHLDLVKEISDKAEYEADELRKAVAEEERRLEEERLAILMRKALRKARRDILLDLPEE